MAIDCFIDDDGVQDIPVRNCETAESISGLFINDLLDFSVESLDALATKEKPTWKLVYDAAYTRATTQTLSRENFTELEKCYKVKTRVCADDIVCDNKELYYQTLQYFIGFELLYDRIYTNRWNGWTINIEKAKELRAEYWTLALRELKATVKTIEINSTDSECFQCGPSGQGAVYSVEVTG